MMADPELIPKHHKQAEIAYNRPEYREARWERAVKVRREAGVPPRL